MSYQQLSDVIFEDMVPEHDRLLGGGRLVHYTSAEAASKIITGECVWLRNALLMNDFSEIEHGLKCLHAAWSSKAGLKFRNWLDSIIPGFTELLAQKFDEETPGHRQATFMMSLSEHDDKEDDLGRLSMWRAYGGKCGVALVLKPTAFMSVTDEIKVYSAPVRYMDEYEFVAWFTDWAPKLEKHGDLFLSCQVDGLAELLLHVFRVFTLCTKHPGFREEREWRIFHSPLRDGESNWLKQENEIIAGLPQEVIKLRLMDDESKGVKGVSLKTLIDRVIIGPTLHPVPVYHALFRCLQNVGFEDPSKIMHISHIPLRN